MEFPRVFITGWECRECPRKLKHLSFFLHEEKDDAGKEVCVVCCVLCVGGVIKGPMPPAPCPQPHAPQPHAPQPHASRGERGEPIRMASNTSPSPFKPPAPCLMPPAPCLSRRAKSSRSPCLRDDLISMSPSPESNGAGAIGPDSNVCPSPMPPGPRGHGAQVHLHGFTPCPMLMEMMAIDAGFVIFPPYSLNFPWNFQGFYHGMGMSRMP